MVNEWELERASQGVRDRVCEGRMGQGETQIGEEKEKREEEYEENLKRAAPGFGTLSW